MAEAKDKAQWNHTFAILSGLANVRQGFSTKPGKPLDPLRFFPYRTETRKPARPMSDEDRETLRKMFPGG